MDPEGRPFRKKWPLLSLNVVLFLLIIIANVKLLPSLSEIKGRGGGGGVSKRKGKGLEKGKLPLSEALVELGRIS